MQVMVDGPAAHTAWAGAACDLVLDGDKPSKAAQWSGAEWQAAIRYGLFWLLVFS